MRLVAEGQRHRAVGGNALRAAVLGANDGLVSNFSLVMGVAGAESSGAAILSARVCPPTLTYWHTVPRGRV